MTLLMTACAPKERSEDNHIPEKGNVSLTDWKMEGDRLIFTIGATVDDIDLDEIYEEIYQEPTDATLDAQNDYAMHWGIKTDTPFDEYFLISEIQEYQL